MPNWQAMHSGNIPLHFNSPLVGSLFLLTKISWEREGGIGAGASQSIFVVLALECVGAPKILPLLLSYLIQILCNSPTAFVGYYSSRLKVLTKDEHHEHLDRCHPAALLHELSHEA